MASIKVIIFDNDEMYVRNLMEYINEFSEYNIKLNGFCNKHILASFLNGNKLDYDIILTSSVEGLQIYDYDKVLKLKSRDSKYEEGIYKYQSLDYILNQILQKYVDING